MARKTRRTRRRVKRVKGTRRIRRIRRIKTYYKGGNRRQNTKGGSFIDDIKNGAKSLVEQTTAQATKAGSEVQGNFDKVKQEVENQISEVKSKIDTPDQVSQ